MRVLLVEDNPGDRRLMAEMFAEARAGLELHTAADGMEALGFLQRQGRFDSAPRPDLVLLDLNMPGISGIEVLDRIRASEELQALPVIVLSSSRNENDMARSHELGADAVWRKPFEIEQYLNMTREIERFLTGPEQDGREKGLKRDQDGIIKSGGNKQDRKDGVCAMNVNGAERKSA